MTELVDPYEVFWSKAQAVGQLQDPSVLLPQESATAQRIEREGHTEDLVLAAAALAGAFYLYRNYMAPRIKAYLASRRAEPSTLALAVASIWQAFLPHWVAMVTPALTAGYIQGIAEAEAGTIPEQYLADIADNYARQLGEHMNAVSAEALMAGYQAQLNRKVPQARALEQVLMAYGVPPKTMNALISVWNAEDPKRLTTIPMESVRDQRARALIETELAKRGEQIGENETWSTKSQAKQIVWMYGMQSGVIPPTAQRVWVTAHDEKVCKYCGPLHKMEAPLNEQFKTDLGLVWTPPLHINCRCDVVLDYHVTEHMQQQLDELLASEAGPIKKAYDKREPRDERGRWTAKPQKKAAAPRANPFRPAPTKTPYTDPALAHILRQIAEHEEQLEQAQDQRLQGRVEGRLAPTERAAPTTGRLPGRVSGRIGGEAAPVERLSAAQERLTGPERLQQERIVPERLVVGRLTPMDQRVVDDQERIKTPPKRVPPQPPKKTPPHAPQYQMAPEPLYVVLRPEDANTSTDVWWTDFDHRFFTRNRINKSTGLDDLQTDLGRYWSEWIKEDTKAAFPESRISENTDKVWFQRESPYGTTMQISVSRTVYQDLLDQEISGVKPGDVTVPVEAIEVDSSGNPVDDDINWDELDEDGRVKPEIVDMDAVDVIQGLGIDERVRQATPIIMQTDKVNSDQGDLKFDLRHGIEHSNPGRWRVTPANVPWDDIADQKFKLYYGDPADE